MGNIIAPDYLPRGFKRFVAGPAYVADIHRGQIVRVNLGAPATLDADGILNDASNGTAAAGTTYTSFAAAYDAAAGLSGRYGRNVTAVASTTATNTITISGFDYLGQPLKETITLASTTTVQGNKAFKYVTGVTINTGTGTTTIDVGWGNRLGLPYKTLQCLMSYEDNAPFSFGTTYETVTVESVEAGAGTTAATLTVPFDGWYIGSTYDVTTAQATAAATIDFIYDGTGTSALDFAVPIAAVGLSGGELKGVANWLAVKGGRTITLTSDSGGDTGVITVHAHFSRGKAGAAFVAGDATTATATTYDTRGVFIPATACNGTIVYEVDILPDFDYTWGVAQYFA